MQENDNQTEKTEPLDAVSFTGKKEGRGACPKKAGKVCCWKKKKTMTSKTLAIKNEEISVDGGASDEEEHYNITSEMDELKKLSVVGL